MNINLKIIDEVISSSPRDAEDNRESVIHLMKSHHRLFPSGVLDGISELRNTTTEQQLMLLYHWVNDGYRSGSLTGDQVKLLRDPLGTIMKRILKEDKHCLTHKLWNRAIRSGTRDEPMSESLHEEEAILHALEPAADLAALQDAFPDDHPYTRDLTTTIE